MYFGAHFSIQGGLHRSAERAKEIGCTTFQIFTRSSRSWKSKPLDPQDAVAFKEKSSELGFSKLVVHLPYLPNFATSDKAIAEKSRGSLMDEVQRCDMLGISDLVIHIGSHKGEGLDAGIRNVVEHLDRIVDINPKVKVCLETSAGTKNSVGSKFEEIGTILSKVSDAKVFGVCFDTAHVFAAGYDIRTPETVETTMETFDSAIGFNMLRVIHCNDSKTEYGGNADRHEHIGKGHIGTEGFKAFFSNKRIQSLDVPVILETPENEEGNHETNFKALKSIVGF